jgi:hypothetical protein
MTLPRLLSEQRHTVFGKPFSPPGSIPRKNVLLSSTLLRTGRFSGGFTRIRGPVVRTGRLDQTCSKKAGRNSEDKPRVPLTAGWGLSAFTCFDSPGRTRLRSDKVINRPARRESPPPISTGGPAGQTRREECPLPNNCQLYYFTARRDLNIRPTFKSRPAKTSIPAAYTRIKSKKSTNNNSFSPAI